MKNKVPRSRSIASTAGGRDSNGNPLSGIKRGIALIGPNGKLGVDSSLRMPPRRMKKDGTAPAAQTNDGADWLRRLN
jgi:hypothetical protein